MISKPIKKKMLSYLNRSYYFPQFRQLFRQTTAKKRVTKPCKLIAILNMASADEISGETTVVVAYVNILKVNANEVFPYQYAAFHFQNKEKEQKGTGERKTRKTILNRLHFDRYISGGIRVLHYFSKS